MVVIYLDTDSSKQVTLNPSEFQNIAQMSAKLAKTFGIEDVQERNYGLRDYDQGILLSKIEDIRKCCL